MRSFQLLHPCISLQTLANGAWARDTRGEATGEVRICGANTAEEEEEEEDETTSLLAVVLELGRETTWGRTRVWSDFRNGTCFGLGLWNKDLAAIIGRKCKG